MAARALAWPAHRLALAIGVLGDDRHRPARRVRARRADAAGRRPHLRADGRRPDGAAHVRLRLPRRGAVARPRAALRPRLLVQRDRLAVLGRGRCGPVRAARALRHPAADLAAAGVRARPVAAAARRQPAPGLQPRPVDGPRHGDRRAVHRRAPPGPAGDDDARRRAEPRVGVVPRAAGLRRLGAAAAGPRGARARARRRCAGRGGVRARCASRSPRWQGDGPRLRRVAHRRPVGGARRRPARVERRGAPAGAHLRPALAARAAGAARLLVCAPRAVLHRCACWR